MNPDTTTTVDAIGTAVEAVEAVVGERAKRLIYVDVRFIYIFGLLGFVLVLVSHKVDNQTRVVLAVVNIIYLFAHMSYLNRRPEEIEVARQLAKDPRKIGQDDRYVVVPKRVVGFLCFLVLVYLVFIRFHFFGSLSNFLTILVKFIKKR